MVKYIKKYNRICLIIVLCCVFFCLGSVTVWAQQKNVTTVKAGFFMRSGYHMIDENGVKSGYGYEFLMKLSRYSDLEFEYVGYENSWSDMLEMLKKGEIDILTAAHMNQERNMDFDFTEKSIGTNYSVLTVKKGNTAVRAGDYTTYDGMRVAMISGNSRNKGFDTFAEEHNFSYEPAYYEVTEEAEEALQAGEVDALVTSNFRELTNEVVLDSFDYEKFYAIVRKGEEELLAKVNAAIDELDTYESNWRALLNDKYYNFGDAAAMRFSEKEQSLIRQYQKEGKVLKAVCNPDRYPYSYFEDGQAKGIIPDIFDQVMEKLGLKYEIVETSTRQEYQEAIVSGEVDLVIDQQIDAGKADNLGYIQTISYLTTSLCRVQRKDFNGNIDTAAIIQASDYQKVAALQTSQNCDLKYYDDYESCFEALKEKEADAAYLLIYIVEAEVSKDASDSLTYTTLTGSEYEMGIGVRKNLDHSLISALTKSIYQVREKDVQPVVDEYLTQIKPDMTLRNFLLANPWLIVLMVVLFLIVAMFIIRYILKSNSERALKKKNAELAEQKRVIGEQIAVINGLASEYFMLFLLDLDMGSFKLYTRDEDTGYEDQIVSAPSADFVAALYNYIDRYTVEEERADLKQQVALENLREVIPEKGIYSINYERISKERMDHCQMNFARVPGIGEKHIVVLGLRVVNDIVEKEMRQKQLLEDALVRAEQASRAKTTFLSNMSHDIRTPMNAIIGFTALATTHIDDEERVKDYLGKIMTSSNHLLSLINDVLDMSRIESGKIQLTETECNLAEVMHDLKNIIQTDIHSRQLELLIDTVDVLDEDVYCDKLRLNQILLNLLGNAMKFTPPGGMISVRVIEKKGERHGYGSYEFRVKDTGIGMSHEFLENIFEPFERERTSTVSKTQGTGLGMSITKSIVDMMGGTITVTSEKGKGSEFVVNVQMRLQNTPKEPERIPELEGCRALVVDDDFNTCDSVTNMLLQIGMRAEWTMSGKEAVLRTKQAVTRKDTYLVYIIDWLMPDMNGVEVARRVRQEVGDEVPIIILTAYDWSDIEQEAKEAGVTAFCSKPLFMSDLRRCLIRACRSEDEEKCEDQKKGKDFSGKRLLLVEDNELNREIATEILKEVGFEIEAAENGEAAVQMVSEAQPGYYELVLMDIQMPVMDGYEAARAIRKLPVPELASIPIVAMTANAFDEDKKQAFDSGMNAHIAKPIDVDKLLEILNEILS